MADTAGPGSYLVSPLREDVYQTFSIFLGFPPLTLPAPKKNARAQPQPQHANTTLLLLFTDKLFISSDAGLHSAVGLGGGE